MVSVGVRKVLFSAGLVIGKDRIARLWKPRGPISEGEYLGFINGNNAITVENNMMDLSSISGATLDDATGDLHLVAANDKHTTVPRGKFTQMQKAYLGIEETSLDETPKYRMPKTDSELNDMFPVLFPDYKAKMYYDVMRERECIDLSMFDPDILPGRFVDLSEQVEYKYYDALERRLRLLGCEGAPPNIQVRYRVLITKFYDTKRNRFKEWVMGIHWDGVPRIDTWFQKVFAATAPPLEKNGLADLYLAKVARAWFMGAIARMDTATVHEVVPVLVGAQGNGKTSGLRYTAGDPEWFIDTVADVTTPHGKMQFLDSVRGRVIVELAESTQIRTKDQEALKAFISMKEDQYRKPYLRRDDTYPRHFIMAASSNLDDVFTDLTGNRRYYPIYCHRADLTNRNRYDVEQVWAEAYTLYYSGEQPFIASDWYPAVVMQTYATAENSNVSTIENWLDNPDNEGGRYTHIGATVTKEEVFYYVFGVTSSLPSSAYEQAWKAWTKGTRKWAKMDYPIRCPVTHKSARGYIRISIEDGNSAGSSFKEIPEDVLYDTCVASAKFCDRYPIDGGDSVGEEGEFKNVPLKDIFVRICQRHNIVNEYSPFPIEGLTDRTVASLQDKGFIYFDRMKNIYRTVLVLK